MRVAFFGTPEFAVPSLEALLKARFQVVLVVTQPDRPQGRSRSTLVPPAVKSVALAAGLDVLQPDRPVGDVFHKALEHAKPDVGVVVAYGHILKPEILAVPRLGMINVHASLLPRLRGAAPIQRAILTGEESTGITIMQMEAGLDSGPILHAVRTPIGPAESAGELTSRLAELGAQALIDALSLLGAGAARPKAQDHAAATFAPKIGRELAHIDWTADAESVARLVRAMDPEPGGWTELDGHPFKLFGATTTEGTGPAGQALATGPALTIACGTGAIEVRTVQPAGKGKMPASAWASGRHDTPLPRFG
ncbi:MAG: methionyl-tRNA formyltransferase [Gemmatimonadetes bacterium]|nr:methionyl-tRNA formyltransferase [Gemmatimonadota bacterium]